jgi:YVTN family beta-propeller protein
VAGGTAGDIYVTAGLDNGVVYVISPSTNTVIATIPVGNEPQGIAVSAGGYNAGNGNIYVTDLNAGTGNAQLQIITPANNTVTSTIDLGSAGGPESGVAVVPAGAYKGDIYVTNQNIDAVSVINPGNNDIIANIPVGASPTDVAVDATGTTVYVTTSATGSNDAGSLSVISTSTNLVTDTINNIGYRPDGVAVSPTGPYAGDIYVAALPASGDYQNGEVLVIDPALLTVSNTIAVGADPQGLAVSPAGNYAGEIYVANSAAYTVSVIS